MSSNLNIVDKDVKQNPPPLKRPRMDKAQIPLLVEVLEDLKRQDAGKLASPYRWGPPDVRRYSDAGHPQTSTFNKSDKDLPVMIGRIVGELAGNGREHAVMAIYRAARRIAMEDRASLQSAGYDTVSTDKDEDVTKD